MAIKSGYFKCMLHVDLTAGSCERRGLSDAFLETYIGGRGFGARLVWDNLVANDFAVDPLGPENLLVVAAGPLTGLYLPSSGKNSFVAVSPATGIYGDSSMGGGFGVELRQTGIDALAIAGRAPQTSFLFLDGDEAFPTICGTGTEDYFCGSYNFENRATKQYQEFTTPYAGLHQVLRPDDVYRSQMRFELYRWHIPDPVRFQQDIRVTIQALGWRSGGRYLPLQDDIASVAYWYQSLPTAPFPDLPDRDSLEVI